ncbi:hypothetical protein GCM10018783_18780 [Streptomyces griseosporeus]|nr:hypothetical protein GCM10018783_18780 [Streptomyces griseosporeus]
MAGCTDVRITVNSDDDWSIASRVLQSLSEFHEPARPTTKGVWHHFRPDGLKTTPVTLGVWLAGDVRTQVQTSIVESAPPHLRDQFRITVEG